MNHWKKRAVVASIASSLVVPSVVSAAPASVEKPEYDVKERLGLSAKEKSKLLYKQKQEEMKKYSEDTIIVKYSKKLSVADHRRLGGQVIRTYPEFGYDVVKLQKGKKLESTLTNYRKASGVHSAVPSVKVELLGGQADPKAKEMYHLSLLQIDKALTLAGENKVKVAVIDTGIDVNHPELKNKVLAPYNVSDPANPGSPAEHGTHVAGIIASEANNGVGGKGVNPNASILPIDVFSGMLGASDYVVADGILHAIEQGANVINMSIGSFYESPIIKGAVKKAVDKGIVVVAAAGNSGNMEYEYPASFDGVISVGATNDKNQKAYFSTYGPGIDVVAPGENVYSSLYTPFKGSTFANMSGTSMSSPIVAGVASLIKSKYPKLDSYQVNYILQQTAKDLGSKGFDLDYGHGLIDPVAALKMDAKNIPSFKEKTAAEVLKTAVAINASKQGVTKTGSLKEMKQKDWYKVDVNKGDYVQSILEGAANYDYKLELRFYPEGKTESSKPVEIQTVKQSEVEGYLYKADSKGTLVIGVADRNENYSKEGKSTYQLKVMKDQPNQEEKATKENPVKIESLPFKQSGLQLLGEQDAADKHYYTFTFDKPTKLNVDLSALPGLDTELRIYTADMFNEEPPADLPEFEKEMWPYPEYVGNMNGYSKGESLAFEAMPGMEYVLEVSSEATSFASIFDFLFFGGMMSTKGAASAGALLPYELKVDTKELPEDEDGFPVQAVELTPEEIEEMMKEMNPQSKLDRKSTNVLADPYNMEMFFGFSEYGKEELALIKENAKEMTIGQTQEGYFQVMGDQDWYKLNLDESAVYQFAMDKSKTLQPSMTIYEYDEKSDSIFEVYSSWFEENPILHANSAEKAHATLHLDKSKQYFVKTDNMGALSFDPYKLTSKKLKDELPDAHENNDTDIQAKVLKTGSKVKGNFMKQGDVDMFYYKHRQADSLYGFYLNPLQASASEKAGLPFHFTLPLDPLAVIVEDTNGNMRMDGSEINSAMYYDRGWGNEPEAGSFKAKKDVGYFFVLESWTGSNVNGYELSLNALNTKDEDAHSKVVNNIPSKPLSLKKINDKKWEAKAFLNAGVPFGDKDYYQFDVAAKGNYTFTFQTPVELDGVVTVYNAKGQVVKKLDHYMMGDQEIDTLSLEKGKYFVEVKDADLRSSSNPYTLTIQKQ
ncbi:S8 family serine peptidase [Metabacillus iocasae]|uniref:Subtilisin family serine protease n=1 Tax=Priestia iocasae TaxID=2291674 RepID=A0ABS2QX11_9BACI|nr:S8 family serine peptidase [Metabacillus iocasae]MBM7704001.1 subtilisin family serine protease [Metabacillus iocasae]